VTVVVDVALDRVRIPVSSTRIAAIAKHVLKVEKVSNAMLSVAFIPAPAISALNRRHLKKQGSTDVIAFGLGQGKVGPVIGDIYIAPSVVRANAMRLRVPFTEELTRVVVHGTLHVLGYDHPEGERRAESPMWEKQERTVRRLLQRAANK
jgi:probable rRNA maturation factor